MKYKNTKCLHSIFQPAANRVGRLLCFYFILASLILHQNRISGMLMLTLIVLYNFFSFGQLAQQKSETLLTAAQECWNAWMYERLVYVFENSYSFIFDLTDVVEFLFCNVSPPIIKCTHLFVLLSHFYVLSFLSTSFFVCSCFQWNIHLTFANLDFKHDVGDRFTGGDYKSFWCFWQ